MRPWRVSWTNFRGFERTTTFEFPRITILIGRNNVGKTSAYAPLLMLRQTLEARDPGTTLLSRGELLDVGYFRDMVTDHHVDEPIAFNLGITGSYRGAEDGEPKTYRFGRLELAFQSNDGRAVHLGRSRVADMSGRTIITRTREADGSYSVVSPLLPSRQAVGRPLREVTELRRAMGDEQPQGFLFTGVGALVVPRTWREDPERWEKARIWYQAANEVYDLYWEVNRNIGERLRSISYIGPLRSLPLRTFRLSAERPRDVGRDGQFAAELLFRSGDQEVRGRVDEWLRRLGYGALEFEDLGEDFFQVQVCLGGRDSLRVNLAHCGVGLSQLLPLLVQGVVADDRATVIAQQPEIHLNPAQQCLVTDFLIDVAVRSERRVIVETHSEHILLRLRRRIAEGVVDAKDVAVYFMDFRDQRSHVERIPVGEAGEVSRNDWPTGFMEEQLHDSFALATAQVGTTRRDG